MTRWLLAALFAGAVAAPAQAQAPSSSASGAAGPAPAGQAVTLTYARRPIVTLRAQVLGRMPAERANAATRALDDLVARGVTAPVSTRRISDALMLFVGGEAVAAVLPDDVDLLAGETLEHTAAAAASRLQVALAEATELRAGGRLLRAVAEAAAVTAALCILLWLLLRLNRFAARALAAAAERRIARTWSDQAARATHVSYLVPRAASLVIVAAGAVLTYLWLAFVLRRFPYTRPLGESLRSVLLAQIETLGASILDAVPGLFTVALIALAARYASRAAALLFDAVERGRLTMPAVYPETAGPTRRLVTALIWLFALAMAYPYVPGSDSSGFKGISVFVGVIIPLGSSGVVQHLMSGLMVTFSRAIRVGDFARIGDVEGTIQQLGALATKLRTAQGAEITIPNAVVVSQMTTNYSRGTATGGALVPTSVTIGYDTPWRQVEAMLLTAADRTAGIRRTSQAVVWRVALEDYYIKYTLLVAPEDPCRRSELLDRLHTAILDVFNEHDVQIMSPHYVGDPLTPKVVPPSHWHAAPSSPPTVPAGDIALRS
jgi:small-conductance mechanosensitive channel